MNAKQVSIFVQNRNGRLAEVMSFLRDQNVNLRALSLADTQNYGVLRFIAEDPEKIVAACKEAGMMASVSNVEIAKLNDKPGSLAELLCLLADKGVGVEYAYAFVGYTDGSAWVVLRTSDDALAEEVINANGYGIQINNK